MSKIYLSSGISTNYVPRATGYLESVKRHFPYDGPVKPLMFAVNFPQDAKDILGVPAVPVDYARASLQLPKLMMQNGAFVDFVPADWREDDVVIFTDADAYFQRPLTADELAAFAAVKPGQFLGSYNVPNEPQTLLREAGDIFPKKPMDDIARELPGMENMATVNWGFIVARLDSWQELHRRTVALWPTINACFDNPARVQAACIYAASQPGLEIGALSPLVHHHCHRGLKIGLSKDGGVWKLNGEVVAFVHAL